MSYKVIVGEKHSSWPEKPTSNINISGSSSEAEGGGSSPDWNQNDPNGEGYIANRPCYIDSIQYNEIFSKTCSFIDSSGVKISTDQAFELVPGIEYKVVFDGIESMLVCKDLNEGKPSSAPYIGNPKMFFEDMDTGEDFCFINVEETPAIISYVEGDSHQVSLGQYSVIYKELDQNFLPKASDTNLGITRAPFRVIYRDVAYTKDEITSFQRNMNTLPASIWFIAFNNKEGAIYEQIKSIRYDTGYDGLAQYKRGVITYMNGRESKVDASEDGTVTFYKENEKPANYAFTSNILNLEYGPYDNSNYVNIKGGDTGWYGDNDAKAYASVVFSDNIIVNGILQTKHLIVHKRNAGGATLGYADLKLNEDGTFALSDHNVGNFVSYKTRKIFLDEDKEFILASSTEGSTKKFKVTVDDSGTLTTTEIV